MMELTTIIKNQSISMGPVIGLMSWLITRHSEWRQMSMLPEKVWHKSIVCDYYNILAYAAHTMYCPHSIMHIVSHIFIQLCTELQHHMAWPSDLLVAAGK